jgi:alpha-beta hydrolase superfamily lysophospholipase
VGGVLLLHGLTDAPYSFRALGRALQARGYWVLAVRLPGHGTGPSGIADVHWRDWSAAVELGMRHLAVRVGDRPIHMAGYSAGALLAVGYALDAMDSTLEHAPASLVLVSPAIGLHPLAWLQVMEVFDPYKYNSFPASRSLWSSWRRPRPRAETTTPAWRPFSGCVPLWCTLLARSSSPRALLALSRS